MTRIYVGTSVGRNYEVDHAHCLMDLMKHGNVNFAPVKNDALIERSRGRAATRFLESDCDVLLTIDTDILFHTEDALAICDQAMSHDIVVGAYVTRSKTMCKPALQIEQEVTFGPGQPLVPVRWGATGFMAVHRRVIEKMAKRPDMPMCHPRDDSLKFQPFYMPFIVNDLQGDPVFLSEDYAFCARAHEEGFTTWLNPTVRLGHQGLYAYQLDDMFPVENSAVHLPIHVERVAGTVSEISIRRVSPPVESGLPRLERVEV